MASAVRCAAGVLASTFHAKATTGTIRAQLITIPGRPARRLSPAPADRLALADGLGADGDHSQQPAAGRMTHPPRPTIVASHAPRGRRRTDRWTARERAHRKRVDIDPGGRTRWSA